MANTGAPAPRSAADPEATVAGSGSVASLLRDAEDRAVSAPAPAPPGPPPGDWGRSPSIWPRIVGGIGRTLIAAGTLILLFVVYQLWGTGIMEARAQSALRGEFQELIDTSGTTDATDIDGELPESLPAEAVVETGDAAAGTDADAIAEGALGSTDLVDAADLVWDPDPDLYGPPPPPPVDGDAVARMRIPKIGVDKVVVEGVTTGALKNGPGHYPDTPLPGQPGNSAIAGHRTTYGAPFFHFDRLEENDLIYVTTTQGSFQYRIAETLIVGPGDVHVLDPTDDNRLTLTTCHPRWSAAERLIVIAELIGEAAPNEPAAPSADDTEELAGEDVGGEDRADGPAAAGATPDTTRPGGNDEEPTVEAGLGGDRAAALPTVLWALVCASLWIGFWLLGRSWHRLPAYLIGVPVFLVALFFFFEDFSRLLPANI